MSDQNPHQSSSALSPQHFLLAAAFIMPLTFSVWQALLNNFVVERAAFSGAEIGMLQSLREVPGFFERSASADLYGVCRIHDGRKVRLVGGGYQPAVSRELYL